MTMLSSSLVVLFLPIMHYFHAVWASITASVSLPLANTVSSASACLRGLCFVLWFYPVLFLFAKFGFGLGYALYRH
jgi:hypothetical protein